MQHYLIVAFLVSIYFVLPPNHVDKKSKGLCFARRKIKNDPFVSLDSLESWLLYTFVELMWTALIMLRNTEHVLFVSLVSF